MTAYTDAQLWAHLIDRHHYSESDLTGMLDQVERTTPTWNVGDRLALIHRRVHQDGSRLDHFLADVARETLVRVTVDLRLDIDRVTPEIQNALEELAEAMTGQIQGFNNGTGTLFEITVDGDQGDALCPIAGWGTTVREVHS